MVNLPDMDVELLFALGHEVAGGADMPVRIFLQALQSLIQDVIHVSHRGIELRMRLLTMYFQD